MEPGMKRPIRIIAAVAAIVILIVALLLAEKKQSCRAPVYGIFGGLDEFSCFDAYETVDLPDRAELTDGLDIDARRCFSVSFEGYDFNVYAYVFASGEHAAAFAERCGAGDTAESRLYSVVRDDRAMLVTGSGSRSATFFRYLFDHLSEVVTDMYYVRGQ